MYTPISGLPTMSDESTSTAPGVATSFLTASPVICSSLPRSGPRMEYWLRCVEKPPPPKADTSLTVMRRSGLCFAMTSRRTQSMIWFCDIARFTGSMRPT